MSSKSEAEKGIKITEKNGKFELYVDGVQTYIKGVGGTNKIDLAAKNGANAFRTWGGNVESVKRDLALAKANNMFIMQGIGLTKNRASYLDEEYKNKLRKQVRELAEAFKDDPNILVWGIGNEIDHEEKADFGAAWIFVDELAQLIKSIDKRHLVSTVITHNPRALDSIAKYTKHLDLVGINSYGGIGGLEAMVDKSNYKGAYMITEWGPTGFWETSKTQWKAPIEQTSEEKRIVYEDRYNHAISGSKRCLGSFVFLWGQKEERTPTWFSMFVENSVEGLPLKGEGTPMVEAMERVWKGVELTQTAPVIHQFTINGKTPIENVTVTAGQSFEGNVAVTDKEGDKLTCVWEILKEATVLGSGGSREPRPDRVGKVETTETNSFKSAITEPGNYRLYVYVLDNTGFASTANVPFQVTK
ncbi:MAG TPA: beta-galactosidase [Prolixibacteraceae bacterium]